MAFTPPQQIKKWARIRPLADGNFADTWIYQDLENVKESYAAFKFLMRRAGQEPIKVTQKRFERERTILSQLSNTHVSKLIDDDLHANPPWIATTLFPGPSLKSEISEERKYDIADWTKLAHDVLTGLEYVHSLGIVHRDLNPGNIVCTNKVYRIIDFGISTSGESLRHYAGYQQIAHRLYASPEQISGGQFDSKSDIFSLATLLVYAATNRSPWSTDKIIGTKSDLPGHIFTEVEYNTVKSEPHYYDLSSGQKQLLAQMHEKNPKKRLTAEQALNELDKISTKHFVIPLTGTPAKTPTRPAPVPIKKSVAASRTLKKNPNLVISQNRVTVVGEGFAHIDPVELTISGNNVRVEPPKWPISNAKGNGSNNSGLITQFVENYWKDILIFSFASPIGWVIYRIYKNRKRTTISEPKKKSANIRSWKIAFLATHGLSFGFFGPIAGIPLAYHFKKPFTIMFATINFFAVLTFLTEIISTPEGGEGGLGATIIWIINYILGFFLPAVMKYDSRETGDENLEKSMKAKADDKKAKAEDKSATDKIDPFDDEEYLANAQAAAQAPKISQTWEKLQAVTTQILTESGIDSFNIEFAQPLISGIYFQGYREKSGCITIEAAANLSVRPELTREQGRNIIRAGWEPPVDDNPNYVKFLDLTQSNLEFIVTLIIKTLNEGYGVAIDGLQPVFRVSIDGEVTSISFEDFKNLTS